MIIDRHNRIIVFQSEHKNLKNINDAIHVLCNTKLGMCDIFDANYIAVYCDFNVEFVKKRTDNIPLSIFEKVAYLINEDKKDIDKTVVLK